MVSKHAGDSPITSVAEYLSDIGVELLESGDRDMS
jgi:hypothetical protein